MRRLRVWWYRRVWRRLAREVEWTDIALGDTLDRIRFRATKFRSRIVYWLLVTRDPDR